MSLAYSRRAAEGRSGSGRGRGLGVHAYAQAGRGRGGVQQPTGAMQCIARLLHRSRCRLHRPPARQRQHLQAGQAGAPSEDVTGLLLQTARITTSKCRFPSALAAAPPPKRKRSARRQQRPSSVAHLRSPLLLPLLPLDVLEHVGGGVAGPQGLMSMEGTQQGREGGGGAPHIASGTSQRHVTRHGGTHGTRAAGMNACAVARGTHCVH